MEKALKNLGYKLNERKLSDIEEFFSMDYRALTFYDSKSAIVYYGLESVASPKLPNVTVISNLMAKQGTIFGSTMGHQHLGVTRNDTRLAQEIYEFQSDGAILLRTGSTSRLHILERGEKVIVSPAENMTLFNLGQEELHLLDYADPLRNFANKDLERRIGPLLLMGLEGANLFCRINAQYLEEGLIKTLRTGHVQFKLDNSVSVKENFAAHARDFAREGIEVVIGGNLPRDYKGLTRPLLTLAITQDWSLWDLLGLET